MAECAGVTRKSQGSPGKSVDGSTRPISSDETRLNHNRAPRGCCVQEMFTYGAPWPQTTSPPITIGAMPQPVLTVFLIIAAIAIVVVLIAVIVIALRAQRRRKLAQTLEKRRDDEVQYAFIVNPSKPQAEARRLHIQRFCEAKGLNRIRFYDTQLDKDGR
ncbi:diacylglycerol kinase, partial [Bifidobacterium longum]